MITDDHEVADTEGLVDPPSSIRYEEVLDAEELHDTYGEGHLLHGVPFVVVEATLHTEYRYARERPCDEVPFMTDSGRVREVRDLAIGDDSGMLKHFTEITQSATEDDSGLRVLRKARSEIVSSLVIMLVKHSDWNISC